MGQEHIPQQYGGRGRGLRLGEVGHSRSDQGSEPAGAHAAVTQTPETFLITEYHAALTFITPGSSGMEF